MTLASAAQPYTVNRCIIYSSYIHYSPHTLNDDTVVSRSVCFRYVGGAIGYVAMLEIFLFLNHEGKPMDIKQYLCW